MAQVDQEKVKELLKTVIQEIRNVIDKNATAVSELAVNSSDPHTPILNMAQMALAQAAVEYLIVCGMTLPEACHATISTTGKAMEAWVKTLSKAAQ